MDLIRSVDWKGIRFFNNRCIARPCSEPSFISESCFVFELLWSEDVQFPIWTVEFTSDSM